MDKYRIMIVDDEQPNLESLERILKAESADLVSFKDPREALNEIRKGGIDLVLTDLRMNAMDGMDLLNAIKALDESVEVILMTAFGTVEIAVEAMKKGAYDFITKPLHRLQVLKAVNKALEKRKLVNENNSLREELKCEMTTGSKNIVGKSVLLKEMMEVADRAAQSKANVLIDGESGTGKGILAEYIHKTGVHSSGIFVKINCMAIPENLLEAELFGYEAGAFTGATKRKKGRIEVAHKGTLFLDEIGISSLSFQAKLLRFLQEGEFERLGGIATQFVDARVISATNSDLKEGITNGKLREDLYYRLNVIHIHVPALRERNDDIPVLAKRFLEDSAKKNGRKTPLLSGESVESLKNYSWPGNIRELQNLMERVVVLDNKGVIGIEDLPPEIGKSKRPRSISVPIGTPLRKIEQIVMSETIKQTDGDKRLAARLLGIHPRTIYRNLEPENDLIDENEEQ